MQRPDMLNIVRISTTTKTVWQLCFCKNL